MRWVRRLWMLLGTLVVLAGISWGTIALAQGDDASRIGNTTLEGSGSAPPNDAPRLAPNEIRRPDPPARFNQHDAGWIHYAYPPEARQRIQRLIENADATRAELNARLGTSVLNDVHVRIARTAGEMTTL